MGQMHHMPQEYFQEFDPEKFAEQIKAQAAAEAAEAAENEAGESATGEAQDGQNTDD
ncbi:hypothetical protein [Corynebacterium halotolerans]|uniref:hypothetical protein n=1 Tax=Corynebacterium halotolerans TaxID=225326 RepID=UPI000348B7A3|nr:hypothetical protein [Corynebacterium halotolerans]